MYPDSIIIAVISTNFTERGDISVLNKWDKTKICLENNVDIVLELPTLYATQSSDIFASAALKILNHFKIDTLVFGTETDNVDMLYKMANTQLNNKEYDNLVQTYLADGVNYPTAMSKALYKLTSMSVSTPNDLLGLAYVKEIIRNEYDIIPVSIKRSNDYHGTSIDNNIISANLIRKMLQEDKDIKLYVPPVTNKYLYRNVSINNAFNLLKYKIINDLDILDGYLTVDEGIENRIIKYINNSNTWLDLVMSIKTKRYTYNKINRMLVHILLGIKKNDNTKDIYLRVLGFNQTGRNYMNKVKKDIKLPIYIGYKRNISKVFDIEFKSTYIYSLIVNDSSLVDKEYKNKPIIK